MTNIDQGMKSLRGLWVGDCIGNMGQLYNVFDILKALEKGLKQFDGQLPLGQFQSSEIQPKGDKWVLNKKLDGPYYQPYPKDKISPDGDMEKMPRSNRKKSEVQYLETNIIISESANGITVDFDMTGTDEVPVSLELIFRRGGQVSGAEAMPQKNDSYLLKGQSGS